jgi:hypothetical protein
MPSLKHVATGDVNLAVTPSGDSGVQEHMEVRMKTALVCPLSFALVLAAAPTQAAGPWPELGLQVHYSQWEGEYTSHGTGGRIRWEPLSWLGVEGTFEALVTDDEAGSQIDIPIGSQIYFPWEFVPGARARALVGLCAMLSLSRGATPHASDSDDIQLGVKAGGGFEIALGGGWTTFADLAWQRYLGHSREVSVWSDKLDGELRPVDRLTIAVGLGVGL